MSIKIIYTLLSLPINRHGISMAAIITTPPIVGTPFFATLNGSIFSSRCVSEMFLRLSNWINQLPTQILIHKPITPATIARNEM